MSWPVFDGTFYHPSGECCTLPSEVGLPYESVFFPSGKDRLHGWFLPANGLASGTVVHCHGNAGNISNHFHHVSWLPPRGWHVLCFDYGGYGRSSGQPTRAGTVRDTRAALKYVGERPDVDPERVVLFGQSLGGAVALVAASDDAPVCGVAVEGAFSDYQKEAEFACRQTWWLGGMGHTISRLFVTRGYDPIDHVAQIAPTPAFFVTGTADAICDHQQTIELYERAGDPKRLWVIEGGQHTRALMDTEGEGQRRISAFFADCVAGMAV